MRPASPCRRDSYVFDFPLFLRIDAAHLDPVYVNRPFENAVGQRDMRLTGQT